MVYLYSVNKTEDLDSRQELLSEQRKERVNSYKFNADKCLCAAAYVLLRFALFEEYKCTTMPHFSFNEQKKPFLTNYDVHFNFSHCDGFVLCGVDKAPLGVDVQNYIPGVSSLKRRFLSGGEAEAFKDEKALIRLWTLKEAYGKYTGQGILYDMKSCDFSGITDSDDMQRYGALYVLSKQIKTAAYSIFSENEIKVKTVTNDDLTRFINKLKSIS